LIRRFSASALILAGLTFCVTRAQMPAVNDIGRSTQDRMDDSGWWPTKGDVPSNQYVGSNTCKSCHGNIADIQETTAMYHAGVRATESQVLKAQQRLTFREPRFSYSLTRDAAGALFSVTDGQRQSTVPAVWAFGAGGYGQTYILEENGAYIESRLSYFTSLNALDTPGQPSNTPRGMKEALGRNMDVETVKNCFRCHTTEAVTSNVLEPDKAIPGVTCESCHGPGVRHVAAMRNGRYEQAAATITNPTFLSPVDSVDFCGACHSTFADVMMAPANRSETVVRFQPYRLELSRCWRYAGSARARITCIACHDPHLPLVRDLSAYDSKCLACHSAVRGSASHISAMTCKVGTSNCASCHMPKVLAPEVHATFIDHDIRVVRGNERDDRKVLQ